MHVHLKVLKRESKRCICGVCSWKVKRDEGEKKEWVGGLLSFPLEPSKACHLCFISTSFVFLSLSLSLATMCSRPCKTWVWYDSWDATCSASWNQAGCTSALLRWRNGACCQRTMGLSWRNHSLVVCTPQGMWAGSRTLYSVCGYVVVGHALCILRVVLLLLITHFVFCVWFCCCCLVLILSCIHACLSFWQDCVL